MLCTLEMKNKPVESSLRSLGTLSIRTNAVRISSHTNAWRNRGFDVLLGTDSPSCNDSINVQAELRFFSAADSYAVTMGETLRKVPKRTYGKTSAFSQR